MSREKRESSVKRHMVMKIRKRQPNRSRIVDLVIYLFLLLMAALMAFPLVFAINSALKPHNCGRNRWAFGHSFHGSLCAFQI